ncbi:hypothetical protein ABTL95_19795, partial [Acinetobacter baumannii]
VSPTQRSAHLRGALPPDPEIMAPRRLVLSTIPVSAFTDFSGRMAAWPHLSRRVLFSGHLL